MDESRVYKFAKFVLLTILLLNAGCTWFANKPGHRQSADNFVKEKRYNEAIESYWQHINERLAVKSKPDWENPYIYLLDIGDIHLQQGQVNEALHFYEMAQQKGVKAAYVNDRYREVARWYESQGQLEAAIEHLKKYRESDEFLIDLMLDRLARKLVESQDQPEDAVQP